MVDPLVVEQLGAQIGIGAGLVILTTITHAIAMRLALQAIRRVHAEEWNVHQWTAVFLTAVFVLAMFFTSVLEALMWAAVYVMVGAIGDIGTALYFSLVTYTTLGFGDVTLSTQWALLSAIEAANGIIMFGWTTALTFWFVQQAHHVGQWKRSA